MRHPVFLDLDQQVKVNAPLEGATDVLPGSHTDLLQCLPFVADDDALLTFFGEDQILIDVKAVFAFLEADRLDVGLVGDLLVEVLKDLLHGHLREPAVEIHLKGGLRRIGPRPFRKLGKESLEERLNAFACGGGDHEEVLERGKALKGESSSDDVLLFDLVDLVKGQEDGKGA